MLDLVWLAIAFPLIGALVNGLFGKRINNKLTSGVIACSALAGSFLVALATYFAYKSANLATPFHEVKLWTWISSGSLSIDAALLVDPLSITMMLFITGISFLIHIYSTSYMSHDEGYSRFFTYLNLFVAMMLILVLGNNAVLMFVGWEGVGLCSYLLIGFWYKEMYNANCGMKAFVVNRVGDFGVLIGIFLIYMYFGRLDFAGLLAEAPGKLAQLEVWVPMVIALFLFLGATGKSAQWPLHIWLPDAMAGPTPVSALIHAATMVTAGVYMVCRFNPIFSASPEAGLVVTAVGCLTAFMAATIALTQNDIKRVLAYSTVSQLGFMFMAAGVGAYWVAIFHVITHAFFKACLFLGSGSVIHAMHEEQDTRVMGGLAKYMPLTYFTFLISTLAIAGIPPLAGFFSKDEILWQIATWQSKYPGAPLAIWAVAVVTAGMTAFYMGRVTFKTFLGKPRWTEHYVKHHHHPHESSKAMTMPLVILANFAVFIGAALFTPAWVGHNQLLPNWLAPSVGLAQEAGHGHASSGITLIAALQGHAVVEEGAHADGVVEGAAPAHGEPFISFGDHTTTELVFAGISVVVAAVMLFFSLGLYRDRYGSTEKFKTGALRPLYEFSQNKWYVDEFYNNVLVRPGVWLAYAFWRVFDVKVIDGFINGVAWVTGALGQVVRPLQTGFVRNYALYMLLGAVIFLLYNIWR